MNFINIISWILRCICACGALNWGFSVFFKFDIVLYLTRIINIRYFDLVCYGIIALSGFYVFVSLFL